MNLIVISLACKTIAKALSQLATALLVLAPIAAMAEPIQLKLSLYGSTQAQTYLHGIKRFVDAVNVEGRGLVTIEIFANGVLAPTQAEQPQLVLDGRADIAFVVPGITPYRFPDNALLELPDLFRNAREGSLVYTRLLAANALRGYQDFFVIGAYTPNPSLIHSSKPIESLAALKGQRIRANNPIEALAMERLGAIPTVMEIPKTANAIRNGTIDGITSSLTGLAEFGLTRVTAHHYLLPAGVAPLALVMNRNKFDGLPETVKATIRNYSGEWSAAVWTEQVDAADRQVNEALKADQSRRVVQPSPSDRETAQAAYKAMRDAWAAKSPRNRELLMLAERELAILRSGD